MVYPDALEKINKIKENGLEIKNSIQELEKRYNRKIEILVASKYGSASEIKILYEQGFRLFGENKLQDGLNKINSLKELDIQWHFIGHLQRNKVRKALQHYTCIHSVDSITLAEKINSINKETQQKTPILIQINTGEETTKFGFKLKDMETQLDEIIKLPYLEIKGIMGVAPFFDETEKCRPLYKELAACFHKAREKHPHIEILSMGMSHDYKIAIEEGATMVRIGRSLFK